MPHAEAGPPLLPPSFFDAATGGDADPADAFAGIAEAMASTTRRDRDWVIETAGDRPVRLSVLEAAPARAAIGFESLGVAGVVTLVPDPSGWILVTIEIGGAERFRAYMDRPYEEYELLPPGARIRRPSEAADADPPGRIGKRRNWIDLDTRHWPALAPLAGPRGHVSLVPRGEAG